MSDKKKKKPPPKKATPGSAAEQKRPNLKMGEPFQNKGSLPSMRAC